MKYRVHLFAQVRVEQEWEADTPEEAARLAFAACDGPVDAVCLVDPLTDTADRAGRLLPDDQWSQWLCVTDVQQRDGTWQTLITPALFVPPSNTRLLEVMPSRT